MSHKIISDWPAAAFGPEFSGLYGILTARNIMIPDGIYKLNSKNVE